LALGLPDFADVLTNFTSSDVSEHEDDDESQPDSSPSLSSSSSDLALALEEDLALVWLLALADFASALADLAASMSTVLKWRGKILKIQIFFHQSALAKKKKTG
jgi:hypothetical protein